MSQYNSLTENINNANISSVRHQICMKNGYSPHYGTVNDAKSVVTDIDHFPYTRFFRGISLSSEPVVFEREAGWRPTRNACYNYNSNKCVKSDKNNYPNHCFESACSTVYPCYPQYLHKYSDRNALNVQLNNECIAQYR